jgi:pyruvate dehydrogenase E1 component alpha subunit
LGYRTEEEEEYYKSRDCIDQLKGYLLENTVASNSDIEKMDDKALKSVESAIKFADESPFPDAEELYTDVYVPSK